MIVLNKDSITKKIMIDGIQLSFPKGESRHASDERVRRFVSINKDLSIIAEEVDKKPPKKEMKKLSKRRAEEPKKEEKKPEIISSSQKGESNKQED